MRINPRNVEKNLRNTVTIEFTMPQTFSFRLWATAIVLRFAAWVAPFPIKVNKEYRKGNK